MANAFTLTKGYIRKHFEDNFSEVPILHENMPKEQVREDDGSMPEEFVYLDIQFGEAVQAGIGKISDRKHRYVGVIMIHIFTHTDAGDGRAMEIADLVSGVFISQSFNGVNCRVPAIDGGSVSGDDANYWRVTVTCPFWVDYNQ